MAVERLFVARMAGLPVVGPDGERIGKVRDLVASLRVDTHAPRVLGMVVELATRRRIFTPMLRVARIDPSAVTLTTGSVSLRGFTQRPNETLVVGQLVDARVRLVGSGDEVVVVDAAVEQTRSRDWVVARLAVRSRRSGLTRRGVVQVVAWKAVTGLTLSDRQGTAGLLSVFETMRAADVASALSELPEKRQHEVVDALDDERLADIFEELSDNDQVTLLEHLDVDRAADVLEAMSPDDAADLLGELPYDDRNALLALMEPAESEPLRRLLSYSSDTAGGLMTPEPVILRPDATVAEALARVRNPDVGAALASMVFVCRSPTETPTGRYLGVVHTQRLLREAPFDLVAGIVDNDLARLHPDATLGEIARYFAAYNLVAGPVVDGEDHLLGAVTVDDVLDHLLPEDWREQMTEDDEATGELDLSELMAGHDSGHDADTEAGRA
jgi:Mg/Co/Ni transporter MgtE